MKLKRMRMCWKGTKGGDRKWVMFDGPGITRRMTKEELVAVLPDEDALKAFTDRRVSDEGKEICPVPFGFHEDLVYWIETETDLCGGDGGWSLKPIDGPSNDWPLVVLKILRHIRAVRGLIQQKNSPDMEQSIEQDGGA